MEKHINQVREFHITYGVPVNNSPQFPEYKRIKLRNNILYEEVAELEDAILKQLKLGNSTVHVRIVS